MVNVTEKRGTVFSVTLADNSTLTLQAGESQTIKNELVSESLKFAEHLGIVSIKEVLTTKEKSHKENGGASK